MFRMFWYEIKMDFLRSIRYRFGMISDLLVYFALFTVFMVTDSGNSYAQTYHYGNYKELVLLGYVAWIYAISAISNVECRGIAAERADTRNLVQEGILKISVTVSVWRIICLLGTA